MPNISIATSFTSLPNLRHSISEVHSTQSAFSSLGDDAPLDESDVEGSENHSESEDEVSTNDTSLPPVTADDAIPHGDQSSTANINEGNELSAAVTASDSTVDETVAANTVTLVLDNEEPEQQEDVEMAVSGRKSRRGRLLKRRKTTISSEKESETCAASNCTERWLGNGGMLGACLRFKIPSLLPGFEESAEPPVVLR
ncbi:hypothetical protein MSAN_00094800 [Mycena sanguinolenta]|uniref:Uncharacterized protein n=1 Tax=Mycena sanguinolenta TaxID=230812 RepID=A0A8H6ZJR3_9AGAR|nr:hypothetical protein MSAN_00094800 [Mycena sanguinolenta]